MRKFFSLLILSLMVTATVIGAQNPATVRLKGKVLDSTALPMAGTAVKVYQGTAAPKEGVAPFKEGVTNNDGDFDIEVPAGDYYIDVSAPDLRHSSRP
ncbi:MAG TPA: carboxypeptidase-like regulatory domain-containing protein [Terriglobia bacterium]|nr:carboxypeptidase-like regulatory domain-containing protein [Terriglobia bacterium]